MKLDARKIVLIGGAVVAAAAIGWFIKVKVFPTAKPPQVATASATMGDVEQTVLATGALEPVTLVSVGAQVSGQLTALHVQLGQAVRRGDLIAEIDSAPQTNALHISQANLTDARAQKVKSAAVLAQAELALRRQGETLAQEASSKADFEAADAAAKTARADLLALDARIASAAVSVQTAGVNLGYTQIRAPIDGTVVAIVTKQGQTVNANQSAPTIVKLGDLRTMTVRAEISEADVIKVHAGQAVYFTILGDAKRRYRATLRSVEPAPETIKTADTITTSSAAAAVYYNALFDVPNADGRLRTFMTAQVNVILAQAQQVLTIPSSALEEPAADGSYTVQVVGEKKRTSPRKVRIGVIGGTSAQVLSGLKAGETVVLAQAAATPAAKATTSGRRSGAMGF